MTRETPDFEDGFKSALIEQGKSPEEAEAALEEFLNTTVRKEVILGVVEDLVADFLYYNRKEDECLPRGEIEKAVQRGVITADEIAEAFARSLKENI